MQKTITVNVPDELWVSGFTQNKTAEFTYNGPDRIWAVIEENFVSPTYYTEEPTSLPERKQAKEIVLATATDTEVAAAIILVNSADEHTYTYADETNHDGSIYKRITNPRLQDIYLVEAVGDTFTLVQVLKDTTNPLTAIANQRLAYVKKYSDQYDFSAEDEAAINTYITNLTSYINTIKTAYPWKYVTYDTTEIPKIPVKLVTLFNSLPTI
jgi:hypothetical protein